MIAKADILGRLKLASNSTSDADLARFLGIAPATLSNWKSRGSLDYDLVFSKCEQLNLDWLLTGRGNMEKEPDLQQAGIQVQEKFPLKTDNLSISSAFPFTIWSDGRIGFPVQRCRCDSDQLYIVAGSAACDGLFTCAGIRCIHYSKAAILSFTSRYTTCSTGFSGVKCTLYRPMSMGTSS